MGLSNAIASELRETTARSLRFFFQAEDGIRDGHVTGVQTCALPISTRPRGRRTGARRGGVIAKAFMLENACRLTEMQRQVLEQSMTQPLTFYEVISSHPGERIVLRDILTGQERAVREHTASKTVENGDIIFAQVLPMQGITTLGCCAPVRIPPRMKAEVIALRKKLRRKAKRENGEIWAQDLARYENDIREVYLNIRDLLNTPPRICNTDGDPLVLHTITFEIESPQAAFEALAPLAKGLSKEQLLKIGRASC